MSPAVMQYVADHLRLQNRQNNEQNETYRSKEELVLRHLITNLVGLRSRSNGRVVLGKPNELKSTIRSPFTGYDNMSAILLVKKKRKKA